MNTSFRNRLATMLAMRGISQTKLACDLDCDKHQVSAWVRGEFRPSLSRFRQICEVLSVSADYMLGRSDAP